MQIEFYYPRIFGYQHTYSHDLVIESLKVVIKEASTPSERLDYLSSVMKHLDLIEPEPLDEFRYLSTMEYDTKMVQTIRSFPIIKSWVKDEIKRNQTLVKKDIQKAHKVIEQITTFKFKDDHGNVIKDLWELMKDKRSNMIHYDTSFEDFETVFQGKPVDDIVSRVVWIGSKVSLLRLFQNMIDFDIVEHQYISRDNDNVLGFCFVSHKTNESFEKWRSSYNQMSGRKTRDQQKIDNVVALFKEDTK